MYNKSKYNVCDNYSVYWECRALCLEHSKSSRGLISEMATWRSYSPSTPDLCLFVVWQCGKCLFTQAGCSEWHYTTTAAAVKRGHSFSMEILNSARLLLVSNAIFTPRGHLTDHPMLQLTLMQEDNWCRGRGSPATRASNRGIAPPEIFSHNRFAPPKIIQEEIILILVILHPKI